MRDINFFECYDTRYNGDNTRYYHQILWLILACIIVGSFFINIVKITILNKEIEKYQVELNKETIKEKIAISEKVTKQLKALTTYEIDLESVITSIESRDIVSNKMLNEISKAVPGNVSFKAMNISKDSISIQAITTNRQSVAELQHNLKSIIYFDNVHVENISGNESVQGEYTFNIKCYINGGVN